MYNVYLCLRHFYDGCADVCSEMPLFLPISSVKLSRDGRRCRKTKEKSISLLHVVRISLCVCARRKWWWKFERQWECHLILASLRAIEYMLFVQFTAPPLLLRWMQGSGRIVKCKHTYSRCHAVMLSFHFLILISIHCEDLNDFRAKMNWRRFGSLSNSFAFNSPDEEDERN